MNNINGTISDAADLSHKSICLSQSSRFANKMIALADRKVAQVKEFVIENQDKFEPSLSKGAPEYTSQNYHYNLRIKNRINVIAEKISRKGDAEPGSWRETRSKIGKLGEAIEKIKISPRTKGEIQGLLERHLQSQSLLDKALEKTFEAMAQHPNNDLEGFVNDIRELLRLGANPRQEDPSMMDVSKKLLRVEAFDILNHSKCEKLKVAAAYELLLGDANGDRVAYELKHKGFLQEALTTQAAVDFFSSFSERLGLITLLLQKSVELGGPKLLSDLMAANIMNCKGWNSGQLALIFSNLPNFCQNDEEAAKVVQVLLESSEKELNEEGEMIEWINFLLKNQVPVEEIMARENFNLNGVRGCDGHSFLSLAISNESFDKAKLAIGCYADVKYGKIDGQSIPVYISEKVKQNESAESYHAIVEEFSGPEKAEEMIPLNNQWKELELYLIKDWK